MNHKWLKVAGELLTEAAEKFSNHGCNDWRWPESWNAEDRWAFAHAMVCDNEHIAPGVPLTERQKQEVDELAVDREFGPPDWWVMAFLGRQLEKGT